MPLDANTATHSPDVGSQSNFAATIALGHSGPAEAYRPSVLVVEDDPRSARVACAHLENAGYRVSVAHSAIEAQQQVQALLPDLLLCDLCLPDMDGISLISWLRGRSESANMPIALITSCDDRQVLARALDAGADDFLAKPVNPLELRSRVRSLLRSKAVADELRKREQAALSFGCRRELDRDPEGGTGAALGRPVALIVEDNPHECHLLQIHLEDLGCETRCATNGAAGMQAAAEFLPDLIVLDILLPDQSGYDFITWLQSNPAFGHARTLVVSGMSEVQDRVKALELGADDFIVKGFDRSEFDARVRRLLRLKKSLDSLNSRCEKALQLAVTDSLTGLYTFGFMQETLQSQLNHARQYGQPYSLIFADVDHFKRVNDHSGHAAGDTALRTVARALRGLVRQSDTLVRYGGEEFVVLLPNTNRADAVKLAERMRETVAAMTIDCQRGPGFQVTMSFGVAAYPVDAADGELLLQRGDAAMYLAKQLGRNRVATIDDAAAVDDGSGKVLIVDDDEKNLRLLEAYLRPEGHHLLYARNGIEAIDAALAHHPDVIIMDAMMPKLSGFDACQRMKQDSRCHLIPIMMVTSLNGREDRLRGIEAGADEFITKPIDKTQLMVRLRALLRHKRDMDSLEDAETVIFALARAVEGRDPTLGDHVERVARYAVGLGQCLGLNKRELIALRHAGIVHDIGKIAIADAILLKQGPLTAEERLIVQQHPEFGYNLLKPLRTFADSLPAVRFHHERLNGSGYPLGLRGPDVPLLAQILAISDVYDALSAQRHYRSALSTEQACEILRDEARRGLHDTDLVETFIARVV
jgi:putative two-component system response regulator